MSAEQKKIAIIGATGNVGRKIVEILLQRNSIAPERIRLFSSARSAGQTLKILNQHFSVENVADYDFKDCYLALFATDSDISKTFAPKAMAAGATVVDSSSAYRLDPNVPLIVPPVNSELVTKSKNLYATANCLACPISVVLKPLHAAANAIRVLASTYQSTSGAGKAAMDELQQHTKKALNGEAFQPVNFKRGIPFNVIPQVDEIRADGFTYEEFKIMEEVRKIISPNLKIAATSVRVPVMVGHSISLAIEFERELSLEEVKKILSQSSGVKVSANDYMTPVEVEGKDDVYVGRFRKDPTTKNGILLWLCSDNLRRGAALDAVEISERITKVWGQ
jgi:aspartate-semialdehyde dehydrogenase